MINKHLLKSHPHPISQTWKMNEWKCSENEMKIVQSGLHIIDYQMNEWMNERINKLQKFSTSPRILHSSYLGDTEVGNWKCNNSASDWMTIYFDGNKNPRNKMKELPAHSLKVIELGWGEIWPILNSYSLRAVKQWNSGVPSVQSVHPLKVIVIVQNFQSNFKIRLQIRWMLHSACLSWCSTFKEVSGINNIWVVVVEFAGGPLDNL